MFRGIYTGTSAMLVQEKMLDVVGNNLANVDTSGFKARVAVNQSFPEVLMDRVERYHIVDEFDKIDPEVEKLYGFGRMRVPIGTISLANVMSETIMSQEMGAVQVTDNPTDILINGPGYFAVQDGAGNTFYTRQGHFNKDATGQLMTHDGMYLQGDGGRITIPEDATRLYISESGQVLADEELVGQISVFTFETPTYLRQVGNSLLTETAESGPAQQVEAPNIVSGALERSNVQVVLEMVRMIEAHRAYEAAGRAVTTQDELTSRLVQAVAKPS